MFANSCSENKAILSKTWQLICMIQKKKHPPTLQKFLNNTCACVSLQNTVTLVVAEASINALWCVSIADYLVMNGLGQ